jgi:hypothetical protein
VVSWLCQLASVFVGAFFIDTQNGRVATKTQLREAGLVDATEHPLPPWHPVNGPGDASTMWYVVMRKQTRGIFIGALCIRHTGRQASLEEQGWTEVPIAEIGVESPA